MSNNILSITKSYSYPKCIFKSSSWAIPIGEKGPHWLKFTFFGATVKSRGKIVLFLFF
ncbi:MAG TPA: hypothetical protein VMW28_08295 [Pelolinea sp.]|nr:hypothetical protein [Pelolinea sp.]